METVTEINVQWQLTADSKIAHWSKIQNAINAELACLTDLRQKRIQAQQAAMAALGHANTDAERQQLLCALTLTQKVLWHTEKEIEKLHVASVQLRT